MWIRFVIGFLVVCVAAAASAVDVVHVPGDVGDLQSAIAAVPNGGVIELAAGTYPSPTNGFIISDPGKFFAIRSGGPAQAVLDGGGVRPVLRLENSAPVPGEQITFENLIFANGLSVTGGRAGGVTVARAHATFVDCSFVNNSSNAVDTGGGGTFVWGGSQVIFIDCDWVGNTAKNEGAGLRLGQSKGFVHRGIFDSNRVNLPNHRDTATGGGFHVTNGTVRVTNTRFHNNQAGYAGGGFYVLGSWTDPIEEPAADAIAANCTFVQNLAVSDPSVDFVNPTEGGGFHIEDHATVRIFHSRFIKNSAENGGGVNLYRADVEIENSVFKGNRATNIGPSTGFGGAIAAISNDVWSDGSVNRRSAILTIRDSYLQGRFEDVGTTAQIGGCLAVIGDGNRRWGEDGVSPPAGSEETRAIAVVEDVVFFDCDVQETDGADGTGVGGAIQAVLTDLALRDSMILRSDAFGDGAGTDWASGGALRSIIDATTSIEGSTLARNSAFRFGGGIYSEGSELFIIGSQLLNNSVDDIFGAHVFATPYQYRNLNQTGNIQDNTVINASDLGPLLFDGDWETGPINDTRYNRNTLFSVTQGQTVYRHSFEPAQTVSGLNSLIVNRLGLTPDTEKSQIDNVDPATAPTAGELLAVPVEVLSVTAVGDAESTTEVFAAYAWNGAIGTLNSEVLTDDAGVRSVGVGSHTLDVDGDEYAVTVEDGAEPALLLSANPPAISSGGSSQLQWITAAGSYLDITIDHGVGFTPGASGSATVSPDVTTTYRMILVTKEGGASGEVTLYVDENLDLIFSDGFESGNTAAWSVGLP